MPINYNFLKRKIFSSKRPQKKSFKCEDCFVILKEKLSGYWCTESSNRGVVLAKILMVTPFNARGDQTTIVFPFLLHRGEDLGPISSLTLENYGNILAGEPFKLEANNVLKTKDTTYFIPLQKEGEFAIIHHRNYCSH